MLAATVPAGLASTYWLSIEHVRPKLPNWRGGPFRLAFLTDLHVDSDADVALTQRAVMEATSFQPDVILFGGDYLTTSPPEKLILLARSLQPLAAAKCSAYGVLGNHDYASGRQKKVIEVLDRCQVRVLVNEEVDVNGVRIIGLDDGACGRPNMKRFQPDDRATLLLLHEPDLIRDAPSWVDLQLSGHGHGGQICLPGGIPMMGTNLARVYLSGMYADAHRPLYVSRGIGTRRVNVRFFCRPEVTLMSLG